MNVDYVYFSLNVIVLMEHLTTFYVSEHILSAVTFNFTSIEVRALT